ncbi:hypothetical protein GE21DRAFT_1640 [Neurospora crassa]|uniref:Uncharacterized protein n=1 Tax=Neurospora crassa (strain ATCC 24698 / 74-OR23-1A / CBS 708.71 / DSM 1257 / FGSC 987) TaxID=367110 RepID=Q7S2J1_NEUCR|nr:hypothetical protein NCU07371 [Neurospora crassa OR74A]EAA29628.1 hypothetical protein NCU07371 [Neurospora crassa OR74A]KHE79756.1 hypothetical protein GE21DRAFT_1640 [Neurospora crassa]|eukprot:XP_958864.1 hypothetical protein NCU07371 [Neurospora crassa OR74A]
MSGFPKRSAAFNPHAYRSQAAYDAHKNSLNSTNRKPTDEPKPTGPFDRNAYRSQEALVAPQNTLRGDTHPPKKQSFDMPRSNNSFIPHGYRSQAGHRSNKNNLRAGNNHLKQQFQKKRPAKPGKGSRTQSGAEGPHCMSDAEVREWFRQADIEYENKKKAGYIKDYVPAGGHAPDFSAFRAKFPASNVIAPGMKNSLHAPLETTESAKP